MIVPLSAVHIDEIEKIEKESFSDAWKKSTFMDLLKNPFSVCYVAVDEKSQSDGGEVIGYIMMYHVFSDGQILNIAVKNTRRGEKIATQMLTALLEYARETDIETLTLEVRKSNLPARALYKKFGFESVGIRKDYYKNPTEDAVLMTMIVK